MNVIVYVLRAEAVVTLAERTVAELHIRIIRVRLPADAALARIGSAVLLPVYPSGRLFVVYDLGPAADPRDKGENVSSAEDEEVEQSDDRDEAVREALPDYARYKEHYIYERQPFHLDRNNKEKQYLHIRKQHGKGQEHGQIDIV